MIFTDESFVSQNPGPSQFVDREETYPFSTMKEYLRVKRIISVTSNP